MNVALRRPRMSVDEFLAWENRQEERWEFDGFGPRAMVGGTVAHNVIIGSLSSASGNDCWGDAEFTPRASNSSSPTRSAIGCYGGLHPYRERCALRH
jgi:hypothetical protein